MTDVKPGQAFPSDLATEYDQIMFILNQSLAFVRTATLVQVKAVTNNGEIAIAGTVDVQPLVKMLDGLGNTSRHSIVYGLPYLRMQAGVNAIILDPKVGDIGIAVFADRDISKVKVTKAEAPPGSWRRFSFPDGLYLGGVLNPVPTQYLRYHDGGISVFDKNGNKVELTSDGIKITDKFGHIINMVSGKIQITGNVEITGTLSATGSITAGQGTGDQVGLQTHVHSGVQSGASSTNAPTAGT